MRCFYSAAGIGIFGCFRSTFREHLAFAFNYTRGPGRLHLVKVIRKWSLALVVWKNANRRIHLRGGVYIDRLCLRWQVNAGLSSLCNFVGICLIIGNHSRRCECDYWRRLGERPRGELRPLRTSAVRQILAFAERSAS